MKKDIRRANYNLANLMNLGPSIRGKVYSMVANETLLALFLIEKSELESLPTNSTGFRVKIRDENYYLSMDRFKVEGNLVSVTDAFTDEFNGTQLIDALLKLFRPESYITAVFTYEANNLKIFSHEVDQSSFMDNHFRVYPKVKTLLIYNKEHSQVNEIHDLDSALETMESIRNVIKYLIDTEVYG